MCASEGKVVLCAHHSLIVPLHKPATPKIKKYGKNKDDELYLSLHYKRQTITFFILPSGSNDDIGLAFRYFKGTIISLLSINRQRTFLYNQRSEVKTPNTDR
jgi:hypothetical protein